MAGEHTLAEPRLKVALGLSTCSPKQWNIHESSFYTFLQLIIYSFWDMP